MYIVTMVWQTWDQACPTCRVDPLGENPAVTETGSWICNCVWQIHPARAIRRNPLIAAVSDDGPMSGIGLDWINYWSNITLSEPILEVEVE